MQKAVYWLNSHKVQSALQSIKSNLKSYGEGRKRFFQEKLIEHFFNHGHNGSYKDVMVQRIDFCDPDNQEKREDFWMDKLQTLYAEGLNMKRINQ